MTTINLCREMEKISIYDQYTYIYIYIQVYMYIKCTFRELEKITESTISGLGLRSQKVKQSPEPVSFCNPEELNSQRGPPLGSTGETRLGFRL